MKKSIASILVALLGLGPCFGAPIVTKKEKALLAVIDSLKQVNSQQVTAIETLSSQLAVSDSLLAIYREEDEQRAAAFDSAYFSEDGLDSLVNVIDLQKVIANMPTAQTTDDDIAKLSTAIPDSVFIKRLDAMNSFISVPYNWVVKSQIVTYAEKNKAKMSKVISLYNYYAPYFNEIFDRYGIPEELKCMAIIESMMNPVAVSKAGAKGMWQFMYGTAKLNGLRIDSFVDERMDPFLSCEAAAKYMKASYSVFGDWNLAIASYNCGFGNIRKAIKRAGGKKGFWDIYPYLPTETRGYLPAFVAALYTTTYYKEHGIELTPAGLPIQVDTFVVNKMVHFEQIASVVGVPMKTLTDLNPQYKAKIIPAGGDFVLRIPREYSDAFMDKEADIYAYRKSELLSETQIQKVKAGGDGSFTIYKVRQGDNLSVIAKRYPRVTVKDIMRENHMSSSMIRVGQKLRIPIK